MTNAAKTGRLKAGRDDWLLRIAEQHSPDAVACVTSQMTVPQEFWYAVEDAQYENGTTEHAVLIRVRAGRRRKRLSNCKNVRYHGFQTKKARRDWIDLNPEKRRTISMADWHLQMVLEVEEVRIAERLTGETIYRPVPELRVMGHREGPLIRYHDE